MEVPVAPSLRPHEPGRGAQTRAARWWPSGWAVVWCALLGVMTTVGVAWALKFGYARGGYGVLPKTSLVINIRALGGLEAEAVREAQQAGDALPEVVESLEWPIAVPPDWAEPESSSIERGLGVKILFVVTGATQKGVPYRRLISMRFGVPFVALRQDHANDGRMRGRDHPWHHGIAFGGITFPLKPHFPGILFDAVFWGAAWLAIVSAFRAFRMRRRSKRGLCVKCTYQLAGLAVCPECGASVKT